MWVCWTVIMNEVRSIQRIANPKQIRFHIISGGGKAPSSKSRSRRWAKQKPRNASSWNDGSCVKCGKPGMMGRSFSHAPKRCFDMSRDLCRLFANHQGYTWQHVEGFLPTRQGISWPNPLRSTTSRRRFPMAIFPSPKWTRSTCLSISFPIFHN